MLSYQSRYTPPFLKFLVVERFHSEETIDLQEASNCHMSFMTHWAFPPFDLYNIAAKKRGAWEPVEEFRNRTQGGRGPETAFVSVPTAPTLITPPGARGVRTAT